MSKEKTVREMHDEYRKQRTAVSPSDKVKALRLLAEIVARAEYLDEVSKELTPVIEAAKTASQQILKRLSLEELEQVMGL